MEIAVAEKALLASTLDWRIVIIGLINYLWWRRYAKMAEKQPFNRADPERTESINLHLGEYDSEGYRVSVN